MQLPEALELIHRQVVAGEVQERVQQHRAVAVGEDETIAVWPRRVCRVVPQVPPPQRQPDFGHSHGHARVTGICGLHGVHGQRTNRVGQVLAHLLGKFRRVGGDLIIIGESRSLGEKNHNGGAVSKLAFIGLGVMGFPMAGHLATKGGHELTVYNRSRAKAEAWVTKHKGRLADTPAKAATLMGPSGAGQLTKMVNQICIAGLVQALSEGLSFAIKAGLDAKLVLDVISKGAAQSWQMENRGKTMVDDKFDFGFAVDWMRKDLRICSETAREIGAQLPVTQMVAGFYDEVSKMGGGRWDTSSLIRRLRRA